MYRDLEIKNATIVSQPHAVSAAISMGRSCHRTCLSRHRPLPWRLRRRESISSPVLGTLLTHSQPPQQSCGPRGHSDKRNMGKATRSSLTPPRGPLPSSTLLCLRDSETLAENAKALKGGRAVTEGAQVSGDCAAGTLASPQPASED